MSELQFSEFVESEAGREVFCMSVRLPELGLVAYREFVEPGRDQAWHRREFRAQLKDPATVERLQREKRTAEARHLVAVNEENQNRDRDMTQQNASTQIAGTINTVKDEQTISDKFRKRELVVDTGGDYPQLIAIEFVNDKIDLISQCESGDSVTVECNVRGREWRSPSGEVRHFVSMQGWRIEVAKKYSGQGDSRRDDDRRDNDRQRPAPPNGPPPGDDDIPF